MAKENEEAGMELMPIQAPGEFMLAATGHGPIPESDTSGATRRIREAIFAVQSPEELITAGKAVGAGDVLGVPIEVHDVQLSKSGFEGEGLGVFAIMDCVRGDNGEQFVLTTSAENVVLRVCVAKDRGWLPLAFKIEKADRETARGFTPYVVKAL